MADVLAPQGYISSASAEKALQATLTTNQSCSQQFEALTGQVEKSRNEFEKECEVKSEFCQFFIVLLQLVVVFKNAVDSEREGSWNLLAATVENFMSIFAECDCVNYLHHLSWYLEQIKVLAFTHPALYRHFTLSQWVVSNRPG